jgi:chaperonin GroES
MAKIKPLHDRLLVKRAEELNKTKGGIYLPGTATEEPQIGTVIAAGEGRVSEEGKVHPLMVKKGNKVLFGKYSGTKVNVDDEELLFMREEDILAIVED